MTKFTTMILASMLAASSTAHGGGNHAGKDHGAHSAASQGMPVQSAMAQGEIRKVDKEAKKITIKHGQLGDMPAMTMVFQVKDPAMLDQVKAGDNVKFEAEKIGGAFTVTKIEPAH